jgi:transposase InsO family protein
VSPESCVQTACELVPGVLSVRRLPGPITRPILRLICYPKPGLLQLRVLSSLATSLTFLPGKAASIWLLVIDLFSRAILGWKLSDSLHADLVVDATTRAIDSGLLPRGAIFHSDRGCQYSVAPNAPPPLRLSITSRPSTTEGASIVPSVIFPPTLSSIVIFKTKIPT